MRNYGVLAKCCKMVRHFVRALLAYKYFIANFIHFHFIYFVNELIDPEKFNLRYSLIQLYYIHLYFKLRYTIYRRRFDGNSPNLHLHLQCENVSFPHDSRFEKYRNMWWEEMYWYFLLASMAYRYFWRASLILLAWPEINVLALQPCISSWIELDFHK